MTRTAGKDGCMTTDAQGESKVDYLGGALSSALDWEHRAREAEARALELEDAIRLVLDSPAPPVNLRALRMVLRASADSVGEETHAQKEETKAEGADADVGGDRGVAQEGSEGRGRAGQDLAGSVSTDAGPATSPDRVKFPAFRAYQEAPRVSKTSGAVGPEGKHCSPPSSVAGADPTVLSHAPARGPDRGRHLYQEDTCTDIASGIVTEYFGPDSGEGAYLEELIARAIERERRPRPAEPLPSDERDRIFAEGAHYGREQAIQVFTSPSSEAKHCGDLKCTPCNEEAERNDGRCQSETTVRDGMGVDTFRCTRPRGHAGAHESGAECEWTDGPFVEERTAEPRPNTGERCEMHGAPAVGDGFACGCDQGRPPETFAQRQARTMADQPRTNDARSSRFVRWSSESGLYVSSCPELDVVSQGRTELEALASLVDAIALTAKHRAATPVPAPPRTDDGGLLNKAIRYLQTWFPDDGESPRLQWNEHDGEVQDLVDLLRPAEAPCSETPLHATAGARCVVTNLCDMRAFYKRPGFDATGRLVGILESAINLIEGYDCFKDTEASK